ncbi:hypothetical protein MUK42_02787 [Musa troglodytarum]|uniref:Uncharacterized protein n=1 Tax=Musa troglodytarum TaxID=320322 RepID=A0A9E7JEX9_9LILI|nr:hypothetical protein MUK42_02787 [Musa troglodytarum]
MSSSFNRTPSSHLGSSFANNDLLITFHPLSQQRQGAKKLITSSWKVVEVSSPSIGSKPSKTPIVPQDLVQTREAYDCSSMVTSR